MYDGFLFIIDDAQISPFLGLTMHVLYMFYFSVCMCTYAFTYTCTVHTTIPIDSLHVLTFGLIVYGTENGNGATRSDFFEQSELEE
jgi:hypothetical protein